MDDICGNIMLLIVIAIGIIVALTIWAGMLGLKDTMESRRWAKERETSAREGAAKEDPASLVQLGRIIDEQKRHAHNPYSIDMETYNRFAYRESFELYHKAAMKGSPEGQYEIGIAYAYGKGVQQDKWEAVKWLRKAAEQGNSGARNELAKMGIYE